MLEKARPSQPLLLQADAVTKHHRCRKVRTQAQAQARRRALLKHQWSAAIDFFSLCDHL